MSLTLILAYAKKASSSFARNVSQGYVLMDSDDPIEFPVDGVLDLHTFSPKDVKDLVPEYIEECLRRGITELRIIHGKGTGTLKAVVHALLERNPHVAGFKDAGVGRGGWGATLVRLVR